MIKLQRLNMDTSWHIQWGQDAFLLDPWLIGSEIDGFSWFNEQWHKTPPVAIDLIPPYSSIIISQPFADHLHPETLALLDRNVPILCSPKAENRLKKKLAGQSINPIPDITNDKWYSTGTLDIGSLSPGLKLGASFSGICLRKEKDTIVYLPHGFKLTETYRRILMQFETKVLITSFSTFTLPFFLGGAVNPGLNSALKLVEDLNPTLIVHTHDENKHAKGLVTKIANVNYPDSSTLIAKMSGRFQYVQYEPIEV